MRILVLAISLLTLTVARAGAQCVGDCLGDGVVEISDLVLGVEIALGLASVSDCEAFANYAGVVNIRQLIQGVNNALTGCPGVGRFVDSGDGTIMDQQTGLMWEKKDEAGGLHDVNTQYVWACPSVRGCQPDAAASMTCDEATGGHGECTQCPGTCSALSGAETIWDWINQVNIEEFAGYPDWRIPTVAELEGVLSDPIRCGSAPCVPAKFAVPCTAGCTVLSCSCTQHAYYWTTTGHLFFGPGVGFQSTYVRAVRGGS
jgi:hypothetical protein